MNSSCGYNGNKFNDESIWQHFSIHFHVQTNITVFQLDLILPLMARLTFRESICDGRKMHAQTKKPKLSAWVTMNVNDNDPT